MKKYFKIVTYFLVMAIALQIVACSDDEDLDTSIVLASPKVELSTTIGKTAYFTWLAIAKTAGYACRISNDSGYITEWEMLDAKTTTYATPKIENGHYKLEVYAVGDNNHTRDSKIRELEFDMDFNAKLPTPTLTAIVEGTKVTITWVAIPQCGKYSYSLNGVDWVDVDVATTSVEFASLENGNYTFALKAIGDPTIDTEDSDAATVDFTVQTIDVNKGVIFLRSNGDMALFTEISGNVWTGTFNVKAAESFTVLINGKEYGWLEYSGNGCVGYLNNKYSTVPYQYVPDYYKNYYVEKSAGRMEPMDGAQPVAFYSNLNSDATISMTVDITASDRIPRYWMELVNTPDSKLLIKQNFDLFIWGGDWALGTELTQGSRYQNTTSSNMDGTEQATSFACTYTNAGTTESTWDATASTYVKYRDVVGWTAEHAMEHPGYVRINGNGKLLTPKLSALTGATDIVVDMDILRFSNVGPNTFSVVGGGTVTAVSYAADGATEAVSVSSGLGGETFTITSDMASAYSSPTAVKQGRKAWTHLQFEISGATSSTQVGITGVTSTGRICIDNVVVKRK